ncbi:MULTISPECIES: hypothetical protein [unclassified Tatumella]|uniref:hypothetical protein n=1 Tax=unclassified Tatumella TaxID=2649542 RepID=UPI001BAFD2C1|nr:MULTISPECIES: hypothetical protein [unclassified Tatumella]MBS0854980.1 hypothetical protein [Tatumella sp. JGM16]MBS0912059.1 hypothetical protein [Tatumella sp. JGM91]
MLYSDTVATIAMIVSITAVPASGYLSYMYAIKGEKRKEFNAVADLIRQKLREQLELVELNIFPYSQQVNITTREFNALIDVSPRGNQQKLKKLISEYESVRTQSIDFSDPLVDPVFTNPDGMKVAILKLTPYCSRR